MTIIQTQQTKFEIRIRACAISFTPNVISVTFNMRQGMTLGVTDMTLGLTDIAYAQKFR